MPSQTPLPQLLLVEDDTDLGEVIQTFLCDEGYAVLLATSLAGALALTDTHAFALALTDLLGHSHEHPLAAALPLLERLQPAPVGILTGWPLPEEQAKEQGFAFLLRKPFEVDELLATVAAQLHCMPTPEQQRQMEIVSRYCAAFNAHDLDACLALCAEDIEFAPQTQTPFAEQERIVGRAAYRAHLESELRLEPDVRFETRRMYPRNEGIVMRFEESWAEPAQAGGRARMTATMVFGFEGERIARIAVRFNDQRLRELMSASSIPSMPSMLPTSTATSTMQPPV